MQQCSYLDIMQGLTWKDDDPNAEAQQAEGENGGSKTSTTMDKDQPNKVWE